MKKELNYLVSEYNQKVEGLNEQVCSSLDTSFDFLLDQIPKHFPLEVNKAINCYSVANLKQEIKGRLDELKKHTIFYVKKTKYKDLCLHDLFQNLTPFSTDRHKLNSGKYPDIYQKIIESKSKEIAESLKELLHVHSEQELCTEKFIMDFFSLDSESQKYIKSILKLEMTIRNLHSKLKELEHQSEIERATFAWKKVDV